MRLDKFIAQCTGVSRKDAQYLIKSGEVLVDGQRSQAALLIHQQVVTLSNDTINLPQHIYLMLHKPAGYICANTDAHHPTVMDLLAQHKWHPTLPLQIVGRLDVDTTGLVLLTTDGQWNHRITAPHSKCSKVYRVQLEKPLDITSQQHLERGILLKSEPKPTLPCTIERIDDLTINLAIQEGKYHQIKRMLAAVNNRVIGLHRSKIGAIEIDAKLNPGDFRKLTPNEINEFLPHTNK